MSVPSGCRKVAPLLPIHLDGELDNATTVEVEEHTAACANCREQLLFQQAVKRSLKRAVPAEAPSDAFRAKLLAKLAQANVSPAQDEIAKASEAEKAAQVAEAAPVAVEASSKVVNLAARRPFSWGTVVPFAAAAAALFAWKFHVGGIRTANAADAPLDDIVAEHARPLPPDSHSPDEVRQLERYVGVPVRPQVLGGSAKLVGGRVMPLHRERAAMLQYEVQRGGGQAPQRVSVFIYDPRRIQVDGSEFRPRAVGTAEVRVGHSNGYTVAVAEHHGVGYVLASDLDPDLSAQLLDMQ